MCQLNFLSFCLKINDVLFYTEKYFVNLHFIKTREKQEKNCSSKQSFSKSLIFLSKCWVGGM